MVLEMGHLSCLTVLGTSTINAKMNDGCKYSQESRESSPPQTQKSHRVQRKGPRRSRGFEP